MTLPEGLSENTVYGIQHVSTGLYLAGTQGLQESSTIGVFSSEDDILWDPNSMFKIEKGGHAQGDAATKFNNTIRIKSASEDLYITADGKWSAGDGQTELVLRRDYKITKRKNKDEQMLQKFVLKKVGDNKFRLGSFWNEESRFLFWKTGILHHGPNRIATLHTKGSKVKSSYPTVLNQGYYLDGHSLPNDVFQFIPIEQIPEANIKKRPVFVGNTAKDFDIQFYHKMVLLVMIVLILFLIFYFVIKK